MPPTPSMPLGAQLGAQPGKAGPGQWHCPHGPPGGGGPSLSTWVGALGGG